MNYWYNPYDPKTHDIHYPLRQQVRDTLHELRKCTSFNLGRDDNYFIDTVVTVKETIGKYGDDLPADGLVGIEEALRFVSHLCRHLGKPPRDISVLDLGSGYGGAVAVFGLFGFRTYGVEGYQQRVDGSRQAIQKINELHDSALQPQIITADYYDSQFANMRFADNKTPREIDAFYCYWYGYEWFKDTARAFSFVRPGVIMNPDGGYFDKGEDLQDYEKHSHPGWKPVLVSNLTDYVDAPVGKSPFDGCYRLIEKC